MPEIYDLRFRFVWHRSQAGRTIAGIRVPAECRAATCHNHEFCRFPFCRTALALAGGGRAGFAGAAAPARRERAPRSNWRGWPRRISCRNSRRRTARRGGGSKMRCCWRRSRWPGWRWRGRNGAASRPPTPGSARTWCLCWIVRAACWPPTFCRDRLQRAKFAILDFVRRQSHGRVGLVAFAGSAFIQCPLTFDYDAFEETLLSVDEKTIPIPGTDIGRALNEAYRAMDKGSRRKLVVLVTDGEDLEKSGVAAAKSLATNGVVVFTIGVGTPAGKEIQYANAAGQMELVRDAKGEVVRSRLDEADAPRNRAGHGRQLLSARRARRRLDAKSARRFTALDSASGLRQSAANGVDHFHLPLAVALALMVAESLIGTRQEKCFRQAIMSKWTNTKTMRRRRWLWLFTCCVLAAGDTIRQCARHRAGFLQCRNGVARREKIRRGGKNVPVRAGRAGRARAAAGALQSRPRAVRRRRRRC